MEIRGVRPPGESPSSAGPPFGTPPGEDDRAWATVPERRIEHELVPPDDPRRRTLKLVGLGFLILALGMWIGSVVRRYMTAVAPPPPSAQDALSGQAVRQLMQVAVLERRYRAGHPGYGTLADLVAAKLVPPAVTGATLTVETLRGGEGYWAMAATAPDAAGFVRAYYLTPKGGVLEVLAAGKAPRPSDAGDPPPGAVRVR